MKNNIEILIEFWGPGNNLSGYPTIDKNEPRTQRYTLLDNIDPHKQKKKLFEKLRDKGYWLKAIREADAI